MNKIILSLLTITMSLNLLAQSQENALRFNSNREFKIAQITDTHYQIGNKASDVAIELIEEVIKNEKPDLFVFTGDIVVDIEPILKAWKKVLAPVIKAKIPYAVVLGNHDAEQETSHEEILKYIVSQKYSLTQMEDYVVEVQGNDDNMTLLYMIDSNDYSTLDSVKGYGWIRHEQVSNYRKVSQGYTEANGGTPYPALAFFHIALPEYTEAYNNTKRPPIGLRNENECSPKINTGMFASILEMGDIAGCFVGHDHVNDYVSYLYDVALVYGRFSGGKTTYGDLTNGSRIITIYEGKSGFSTYIRERGGNILQKSEFFR